MPGLLVALAFAGGHDAGQVDADRHGPGHRAGLAVLGGGVADVGKRPCPGDDRQHGDGQRVGDREQPVGGAHGPSGRPGRPGRPSPPRSGLARLLLCRDGGAAPVNAGSFTPGSLLNARAGGHRAARRRGERRAPARPGRNSPHLQKSGLRGPFSLSAPELGAGGAGVPGCYGRSGVPSVDLSCTWRGPAMYPGRFSPVLAAPGRRAGLLTVHLRAARAGRPGASPSCARARFRPLPGAPRWRPWPRRQAAAGAVCSRGSAARRMCRGAGDGSTGTGKTWQRTGTGSPARAAGSRRRRSPGPRRDCPLPARSGLRPGSRSGHRGRSAERADRLAGFANLPPFRTAS